MDVRTFDGMIQHLSQALSRRSLVGGSLGAAVLAAVGLGDEVLARKQGRIQNKKTTARAEHRLDFGERCDPPKTKHGKKHRCNRCRTGFSVATTNSKGKPVHRCACKPVGQPSSSDAQWQCCSGLSDGAVCVNPSTAAPPPCLTVGAGCTPGAGASCCAGLTCPASGAPSTGTCCTPNGGACTAATAGQCCTSNCTSTGSFTGACCSKEAQPCTNTGNVPVQSTCCPGFVCRAGATECNLLT